MESREIYYLGLAFIGLATLVAAFAVPTFLLVKNNLKRQLEADYGEDAAPALRRMRTQGAVGLPGPERPRDPVQPYNQGSAPGSEHQRGMGDPYDPESQHDPVHPHNPGSAHDPVQPRDPAGTLDLGTQPDPEYPHDPGSLPEGEASGPKQVASLYEITRRLGSGGSGIVYLGRHLRLDKDVVLKADKRSLSEGTITSLKREADTLKNLSHEHIPQIFDYVYEDGIVYTVMDYIEGESLDLVLQRDGRISPLKATRWARQVLEALIYLHSRPPNGILHSDIKPGNLMLTPGGDIRLIDFNVALALGEKGAVSVGRSDGYASPEHYGTAHLTSAAPGYAPGAAPSGGNTPHEPDDLAWLETDVVPDKTAPPPPSSAAALDARSDIYGLGATLYHLLTGCRPAQNAFEVAPLTAADCPPGLASVVNKAMSPDRDMRFQTAADMLAALENLHKSDPRARRARRLRRLASAIPAALLAAGLFAVVTGFVRIEAESKAEAFVGASRNAYLRGDKPGAIQLALDAVTAGNGLFTPPVPAAAQKALADALGVYDMSEGFKLFQRITLRSEPQMVDVSPDGAAAAIVYSDGVVLLDLESGQAGSALPLLRSALAETRFLDDTTLVCAGPDGLCAYDITTSKQLWRTDSPAAAIAVSADGSTIAAADIGGSFATLYDAMGNALGRIDFTGGKRRAASDHAQWNPRGDLFELSGGGQYLAASFTDGSLWVINVASGSQHRIKSNYNTSNYVRYEGGFSGNLLAFSGTHANGSYFSVFDAEKAQIDNPEPFFHTATQYGVFAGETGIFVSWDSYLGRYDPTSGTIGQLPLENPCLWSDSNIRGFAIGGGYILVATDGACTFFANDGSLISRFERKTPTDITLISGDYALIGERGGRELTVMRLERYDGAQVFSTDDGDYNYREARICEDGSRVMLFSADGFRLFGSDGALIREQAIPDPRWVYDQQYAKSSGNLAVAYKDALLIYSGISGDVVFEESGLRSVYCAPYGISVLDAAGHLRLIDPDSGAETLAERIGEGETFAVYCGAVIDSAFLDGRELIGAQKTSGGFLFAVSDGDNCVVYDEAFRKRLDVQVSDLARAFFTETAIIISRVHGSPTAFSLRSGRKIGDLDNEDNLIDIVELGEYTVAQYLSADGSLYGDLLDGAFQPVANLPRLCDTWEGQLVFDCRQGTLRRSRIYALYELVELAQAE